MDYFQLDGSDECEDNAIKTHTEDGIPIRKLYVGNLPKFVNPEEIKNLFSEFGEVECVAVQKSKSKFSYAFVTLSTNEGAVRAMKASKRLFFRYKKIRLSAADSWHQPDLVKSNTAIESVLNPSDNENKSEEFNKVEEFDLQRPSLNYLNDDCLLYIFSKLPLRDRIRIEGVCNRWRGLCYMLWNNERHLEFNSSYWGSWKGKLTTQCLRSLLMRCGHSLKSLNIAEQSSNLNNRTLNVISKYCPNLEILNISGLNLTLSGCKALAAKCTKLKELYMVHCPGVSDNELEPILHANEELKVLDISRNSRLTGNCFNFLTDTIEQINLMHCTSLNGEKLTSHLKRFTAINRLILDSCVTLRNYTIKLIAENVPQLQHLSLSNFLPSVTSASMHTICQLTNLISLDISMSSSVNNDTLASIAKGCRLLEKLDVSCSYDGNDGPRNDISDAGVGALVNLPNLQELAINYLKYSSTGLVMLSTSRSLTKLLCRGCPSLGDRGVIAILQYCYNIKEIDVSGCGLITNAIINCAINVLQTRDNSLPSITLTIGGTEVKCTDEMKSVKNLHIINFDLSSKHLRPDYHDEFFSSLQDDEDDDWLSYEDEDDDFYYDEDESSNFSD